MAYETGSQHQQHNAKISLLQPVDIDGIDIFGLGRERDLKANCRGDLYGHPLPCLVSGKFQLIRQNL